MTIPEAKADDYIEFCRGVQALCRIDLEQYKRAQMERRIRTFASGRGVSELPQYLAVLKRDRTELDEFLDRITINVSQLWRNPEQWDVLQQHVLPELARESTRIRAWSAGCSYGAEAYSLAAVAADAVPGTRVEVRGTDIDERIIAKAKTGRFSVADARTAPQRQLARWFERDGDEYVVKPELRRNVRFDTGDLLRMRIAPRSLDLILCRNTVIYFNQEVRDELHARLVEALRPGGVLIVGATERVADAPGLGLSATHPFTYRKSA